MKRATVKLIDQAVKKDKNIREKKKAAAMQKLDESSEEQRPHDKFTRHIHRHNLPGSAPFTPVFKLRD